MHPLRWIILFAAAGTLQACQGDKEPPIVRVGMTLGEVADAMKRVGAERMEGVYSMPWTTPAKAGRRARHGHHVGFLLRDKTAIMVAVQSEPSTLKDERSFQVIELEVGLPGKGYEDKLVWMKEADEGWHRFPKTLDLGDPHRPEAKFDDVQPRE